MHKHLLIATLFTCYLSLVTSSVHASSLIVSPPRINLEGQPGDILQQTIKVTNHSDQTISLSTQVSDFIVGDNSGTPILINTSASGRYLASPWFLLDQSELTLNAGQSQSIVALIEIPKDALPGGHYAGVFFAPATKSTLDTTGAVVTPQVGSLFGITVAGDLTYDALIKEFTVKSTLVEFGPVEFTATIENQSDTHIHPLTKIVIHDMIGRQLAELPLDEVNIFPFTSRTLSGTWETVWGFGRYTATLTAAYGPGLVATRVIYFWIMPYRLITAIVIVLLVLLTLFIVIRRHLIHREDHRDDEIDALKRKIAEMENRDR
jgi:hypothetical protein